MYKAGDLVRVYSLQSFDGGGFICGAEGIVAQDQIGRSVIVSVPRMYGSEIRIDTGYEVYAEQLQLVKKASEKDANIVHEFVNFLRKLKTS